MSLCALERKDRRPLFPIAQARASLRLRAPVICPRIQNVCTKNGQKEKNLVWSETRARLLQTSAHAHHADRLGFAGPIICFDKDA